MSKKGGKSISYDPLKDQRRGVCVDLAHPSLASPDSSSRQIYPGKPDRHGTGMKLCVYPRNLVLRIVRGCCGAGARPHGSIRSVGNTVYARGNMPVGRGTTC